MRRLAHKCPLCGVYLTDKPYFPNSKHLDHILPINQGGTHTHGNVRIICAGCNLSRPKDGSDFTGQLTLWAQGPVPTLGEMCPSGLHEWSPANIEIAGGGKERCQACREAAWRKAVELRAIGWAHP